MAGWATCKYHLGFFQAAGITSAILLFLTTSVFWLYGGGVPPTWTFTVGFWLHYICGWIAIYISLLVQRLASRSILIKSSPKYCFILLVITVILYACGSILFFIPVTQDRMIQYTNYFWKHHTYKVIPPFLYKFQEQYQCCGIKDYKDYNDIDILAKPVKVNKVFNLSIIPSKPVVTFVEPTDAKWYLVEYSYILHGETALTQNNTKTRRMYYFDVSRTCCKFANFVRDKNCGKFVESGHNLRLNEISAQMKINNVSLGCYEKYKRIMDIGWHFQLPWLIALFQWGLLSQAIQYFILIWIYRSALKKLRRDAAAELDDEFLDDTASRIFVQDNFSRSEIGNHSLIPEVDSTIDNRSSPSVSAITTNSPRLLNSTGKKDLKNSKSNEHPGKVNPKQSLPVNKASSQVKAQGKAPESKPSTSTTKK